MSAADVPLLIGKHVVLNSLWYHMRAASDLPRCELATASLGSRGMRTEMERMTFFARSINVNHELGEVVRLTDKGRTHSPPVVGSQVWGIWSVQQAAKWSIVAWSFDVQAW